MRVNIANSIFSPYPISAFYTVILCAKAIKWSITEFNIGHVRAISGIMLFSTQTKANLAFIEWTQINIYYAQTGHTKSNNVIITMYFKYHIVYFLHVINVQEDNIYKFNVCWYLVHSQSN